MDSDELKGLITEAINKGELEHICRIRIYHFLNKQFFFATKKGTNDLEYQIILPIIDKTGGGWRSVGNLYGKPVNPKY